MEAAISFEEAVKDYGPKEIGPVTFSVGRGEIVGFLGPNGSGKSTTIRMLLGLIRPTSGTVRLMQRDPLRDHVRALERVGYSPELPNLQSFLTPKELLRLTAKELGLGRKETDDQLPMLLENVGLIQYQDYKIAKLSKGMVQRLSVAQADDGVSQGPHPRRADDRDRPRGGRAVPVHLQGLRQGRRDDSSCPPTYSPRSSRSAPASS